MVTGSILKFFKAHFHTKFGRGADTYLFLMMIREILKKYWSEGVKYQPYNKDFCVHDFYIVREIIFVHSKFLIKKKFLKIKKRKLR